MLAFNFESDTFVLFGSPVGGKYWGESGGTELIPLSEEASDTVKIVALWSAAVSRDVSAGKVEFQFGNVRMFGEVTEAKELLFAGGIEDCVYDEASKLLLVGE